MRIVNLLFLLFVINSFQSKCQDIEIMTSLGDDESQQDWSILSNRLFVNQQSTIDSTIFLQDTILFTKSPNNNSLSSLKLAPSSSFYFNYNVKDTVFQKSNSDTGEAEIVTVRKQDEIRGKWKSLDSLKTVTLINKSQSNTFQILETENDIYFIRKSIKKP